MVRFARRKKSQYFTIENNTHIPLSPNADLLWGRRKQTSRPPSTAHHGTRCCIMRHSHSCSGTCPLRPQPKPVCRLSALYDAQKEQLGPGQFLVKDSCRCFRVELLAAGINSVSHKQGLAFSSLPGHTGVFSATAVATKVFLIEICGFSE